MRAPIVGRAALHRAIPAAMLLAAGALWSTPSGAQIKPECMALSDPFARMRCSRPLPPPTNPIGPGCQNIVDLAARMECLRRAQVGRMPTPAPRPQAQGCTLAVPCVDRGGRYHLTPSGQKRYL